MKWISLSNSFLSMCTGLRELNLCGCIKVTDITLTHALHLQELQYLNLSHCQAVCRFWYYYIITKSLTTQIFAYVFKYWIYHLSIPSLPQKSEVISSCGVLSYLCVTYQILISMTGRGGRSYKLSTPVPQFGSSHASRLWPDNRSSDPGPFTSPEAY